MAAQVLTITRDDGSFFYPVGTTNGADVPEGGVILTANVRETKGNTCPVERKHRNVVIPEYILPESVPKQFQCVLLDKFYSLAKQYLETVMEESDRMAREIPVEAFSIPSLLEFFGRVAVSNRLTGETVGLWFDASATGKSIMAKCAAKGTSVQKYRDLFIKTASPNHGINPNTCTVLLALMDESDSAEGIGATLVNRWNATVQKSQNSEVDAL